MYKLRRTIKLLAYYIIALFITECQLFSNEIYAFYYLKQFSAALSCLQLKCEILHVVLYFIRYLKTYHTNGTFNWWGKPHKM